MPHTSTRPDEPLDKGWFGWLVWVVGLVGLVVGLVGLVGWFGWLVWLVWVVGLVGLASRQPAITPKPLCSKDAFTWSALLQGRLQRRLGRLGLFG